MNAHESFRELAARAMDAPLSAVERHELVEHRAGCDACRRLEAGLNADAMALATAPALAPPTEVDRSILLALERLDSEGGAPQRAWRPLLVVLVVGLLLAALVGATLGSGVFRLRLVIAPSPTPAPNESPMPPGPGLPLPAQLLNAYYAPDPTDGESVEMTIRTTRLVLPEVSSRAALTPSGLIRVVAIQDEGGCLAGDAGEYPYSLSPEGSRLIIAPGTDDCDARFRQLIGPWLRSLTVESETCNGWPDLCLGQLDTGTYASAKFDPFDEYGPGAAQGPRNLSRYGALTYEVPPGWVNVHDSEDMYTLTTTSQLANWRSGTCRDCPADRDVVVLLRDPVLDSDACEGVGAPAPDRPQIATPSELIESLRTSPKTVVSDVQRTMLAGSPATSFFLIAAGDAPTQCGGDISVDVAGVPILMVDGSAAWYQVPGQRSQVTLVELAGGHMVAIIVNARDDAGLDAFVKETAPILESFAFAPG